MIAALSKMFAQEPADVVVSSDIDLESLTIIQRVLHDRRNHYRNVKSFCDDENLQDYYGKCIEALDKGLKLVQDLINAKGEND